MYVCSKTGEKMLLTSHLPPKFGETTKFGLPPNMVFQKNSRNILNILVVNGLMHKIWKFIEDLYAVLNFVQHMIPQSPLLVSIFDFF